MGSNGKEKYLINNNIKYYQYYPKNKNYWIGTQVIVSGKNTVYLYSSIKLQRFNWSIFGLRHISLGRFDLHYFYRLGTEGLEPSRLSLGNGF